LFDDEGDLQLDETFHCEEWTTSTLNWQYFTHSISLTIAAHAQDVARQTATARATTVGNVDADDDDYVPSQANTPTRNLILATKQGILVGFLDEFEEKSKKHTIHRNIVSTEYRAKVNYDQNFRPLSVT